eukprot:TRINITY_DN2123_c1_g1_i2.p1 TRINITY_DN2123_c1_g1~~TRINITY_DN2123_c1_g1_i2.p1  ORF type:complete len:965 (+),score=312.69 TRINITY_DN2123_c1_g1_i2:38-2932(+)
MPKGPPPRLDFSKKNLEEIKESELDERTRQTQTFLANHNRLTKLPSNFATQLNCLKVLYLNNNALEIFPEGISQLGALDKLHLENNKLTRIPSSIGKLGVLRKLYLSNNLLTTLPDEMGMLTSLQVLDVHNNQISVLSPHLATSITLQQLSIYNNPIQSPPPFVYNKGIIHLLRYMREIKEGLICNTPSDEFIFTRNISFTGDEGGNLKRNASTKPFSRSQSSKIMEKEAVKAEQAFVKKGSLMFGRDVVEDSVMINQNHLLYFLTDHGVYELQGRRDYMEDRCLCLPRLHQKKTNVLIEEVVNLFSKVSFYGIYDGHGGPRAADYLKLKIHKNICNQTAFAKGDFETAIRNGFQQTDDEFLQMCRDYNYMDGTTCVIAMFVDNKLITAHAGDSRIVLCRDRKAIRLTEDHKPDRVDELARVEEHGGEVIFRGNCFRVAGDLAMSRSFGDLRLKEPLNLVISEPEVRVEELTPKDQFIIIASDGLWDVVSDQKACDMVRKCANSEEAARRLTEFALAMGSMDNTTVVVVQLHWTLDFLTQDEIDGKIVMANQQNKPKSRPFLTRTDSQKEEPSSPRSPMRAEDEEISEEKLERMRSESFSFRDNLSGLSVPRKSIYLPASMAAIKLKISIPEISATKLMKFDDSTKIGEIVEVLIQKHRFQTTEPRGIYTKSSKDAPLDREKTLSECGVKDSDEIELRRIGTPASQVESQRTSQPSEPYEEALVPAEERRKSWTENLNSQNSQDYSQTSQTPQVASQDPTPTPVYSPPPIYSPPPSHGNSQVENSTSPATSPRKPSVPSTPPHIRSMSNRPVGRPLPQPRMARSGSSTDVNEMPTPEADPNVSPAARRDTSNEVNLLAGSASTFVLDGKSWKPLGTGKAKVVLIQHLQEKRARVVACAESDNEYLINAWIRPGRQVKEVSDVFYSFSSVVNRTNVAYGISFNTGEEGAKFVEYYQNCLDSLPAE